MRDYNSYVVYIPPQVEWEDILKNRKEPIDWVDLFNGFDDGNYEVTLDDGVEPNDDSFDVAGARQLEADIKSAFERLKNGESLFDSENIDSTVYYATASLLDNYVIASLNTYEDGGEITPADHEKIKKILYGD